jgi:hypothetical protein
MHSLSGKLFVSLILLLRLYLFSEYKERKKERKKEGEKNEKNQMSATRHVVQMP